MAGKHRVEKVTRKSSVSILLVAILAFTGIVTVPTVSNATTPTVSSVSPDSGPAAGGNVITITGTNLRSATAVRIDGVNAAAFTVVSDTEISVTVPTRPASSRTVGQKAVSVVIDGGANAAGEAFYTYRPSIQATAASNLPMVTLSELASRTRAKPITRSANAPFTVTGTDSATGNSYTYTTDANKSNLSNDGWANEGHEAVAGVWPGVSNDLTGEIVTGASFTDAQGVTRSDLVYLKSRGNCDTKDNDSNKVTVNSSLPDVDSYCSVFGPEVYSEAFYGVAGQSLSFEWAAQRRTDDYEIYAFLVSVNSLDVIPEQSLSNHRLLVHGSGRNQAFTTSTGEIPSSGLYRFRFVNGSYDASGGMALGSDMYISPIVTVANANSINLPDLGDKLISTGPETVQVSSTSGNLVTVTASGTSGCQVTSTWTRPITSVTISWSTSEGTCILRASQAAAGAFSAAATVSKGFDVRASATVPTAPTITSVTGGSGSLSIAFTPPNRDGGAVISNYEYSLDNGSTWITLSPSRTSSPLTIAGLTPDSAHQVRIRALNSVGDGPASNMVSGTVASGRSGGEGSTYSPKLTHLSTLPVAPRTNTARVSMFGTYFDTVTEVLVGGKKVEIIRKGRNELVLKLPGGLSGFVDVQIKSTIGALSLPRHFNFGGRANANRAELIVGGFGHNSRVLTPSMRQGIERWLARHPDLKTVTCTGFTSLPRRTTDVALSTNRGRTACDFAKSKRPDLVPSVTQGVEDPRLGSNVRRVRLVLTK